MPRGLTITDVVVCIVLLGLFFLILLVATTRSRESSRLVQCQKNLAQIGLALALYESQGGAYPIVENLQPLDAADHQARENASPGPLRVMLETFGVESFQGFLPNGPAPTASGPVPGEVPVPGFICTSDRSAASGQLRAPVSYRGSTGGDPFGKTGLFATGRALSRQQVEDGDGVSYTAAFAERLAGEPGSAAIPNPRNYAAVAGPLPSEGCTDVWLASQNAVWKSDAGNSWFLADYPSTLYNHSIAPNGSPSCIASDGRSASMGASSAHQRGVNVLMLDGAVRLVQPKIDRAIWRDMASIPDPANSAKPPDAAK